MTKSKIKNIEHIFPILAVDESTNVVVSKNADLTIGFALKLPEVFTPSDADYDTLHTTFVRALATLPNGYVVHKQDWFLEQRHQLNHDTKAYIASNNYLAYENELHFLERTYIEQRSYIFITRPTQEITRRKSLHSSLLKHHYVPKDALDAKFWKEFLDTANQFSSILESTAKIKCDIMKPVDWLGNEMKSGIFQQYFTLSLTDTTLQDVQMKDELRVGGKYTQTFTLADLEDFPTTLSNAQILEKYSTDSTKFPTSLGSQLGLMLGCNHLYNQVFYLEDSDHLSNKLTAEMRRHNSFSAWSKENMVAFEAKDAFIEEMKAEGRRPVRVHYNVLTWHENKEKLEEYRSQTASAISRMGFRPRIANWDAETLFWSCIPGNAAEIGLDNLALCFSEEAVCLWNMEGNYQDAVFTPNGVRLTDRFGKPIMVDPFFKPMEKGLINNRNFMVVGPSGSGKSFGMNALFYYLRSHGVHISIVDVGHSYRRLCDTLGGRYITYEESNPLSFNPFYVKGLHPDAETEESIANLLEALWKKDNELTTKSEEITISDIVSNYFGFLRKEWESGRKHFPSFNTFYDYTQQIYPKIFTQNQGRANIEFDLQNFLYVLRPYAKGGKYEYLLNSRQNIDLMELPFVVYELDNIKDHPVLFPVTTIMIMNNYVRKLFSVRGVLKMLVIEEAWKALAKDNFATFLKWCSKTVRKHYGSLGVVTQEVDDLVGNAFVKDAIINNSPIKFLFDQSNYEKRFDDIMQTLGLSEKQANIILSINRMNDPNRPKYKEMALLIGDYTKVYGVEMSKTAYATFTTEKREVEEIADLTLRRYHGNTEAGIKAWARGERLN